MNEDNLNLNFSIRCVVFTPLIEILFDTEPPLLVSYHEVDRNFSRLWQIMGILTQDLSRFIWCSSRLAYRSESNPLRGRHTMLFGIGICLGVYKQIGRVLKFCFLLPQAPTSSALSPVLSPQLSTPFLLRSFVVFEGPLTGPFAPPNVFLAISMAVLLLVFCSLFHRSKSYDSLGWSEGVMSSMILVQRWFTILRVPIFSLSKTGNPRTCRLTRNDVYARHMLPVIESGSDYVASMQITAMRFTELKRIWLSS